MFKSNEEYSGIKRYDHPEWEGWKIIDRMKGIYREYAAHILERALHSDQLLQEYVKDFYKEYTK